MQRERVKREQILGVQVKGQMLICTWGGATLTGGGPGPPGPPCPL